MHVVLPIRSYGFITSAILIGVIVRCWRLGFGSPELHPQQAANRAWAVGYNNDIMGMFGFALLTDRPSEAEQAVERVAMDEAARKHGNADVYIGKADVVCRLMGEYAGALDKLADLCDLCVRFSVTENALDSEEVGEQLVWPLLVRSFTSPGG
jgi:hypothetical protein